VAVTALVISIVAVLAAGASAFYTRVSAKADKGSLTIEQARHLQERRPDLSAIFKEDQWLQGPWNLMRL
jgi:hypothetical protein